MFPLFRPVLRQPQGFQQQRLGQGTENLAIGQGDPDFARAVLGIENSLDGACEAIVSSCYRGPDGLHVQPSRLDQGHDLGAGGQFQALGAVVGDLRLELDPVGQFQAEQVVATLRDNFMDLAVQLVARTGA